MMEKDTYLKNPCRELSIPYWKAKQTVIPDGIKIVHQDHFQEDAYTQFVDEPYFRLQHDLKNISAPCLPQGYSLCDASPRDFAGHINACYHDIQISEAELQNYTTRPVYVPSLWLAVRNNQTGEIAATGIAELDSECGEGILEWIQVSEKERGYGLGRYLVLELLWRMKDMARFATVSGECENPSHPESLYRKCGFTGNDIWHVLRKRI